MYRSEIERLREGLIIGSACEAGELFRSIVDKEPEERIREIASFYDYLEVQPLGNNEYMIRNGKASGEEELQDFGKIAATAEDRISIVPGVKPGTVPAR
jgi:DNA polymerase-3 subunit alpha (Gram-positive type)